MHFWPLIRTTTTLGPSTGHSGLQITPEGTGTNPKAPFLLETNHSPCNTLSAGNINNTLPEFWEQSNFHCKYGSQAELDQPWTAYIWMIPCYVIYLSIFTLPKEISQNILDKLFLPILSQTTCFYTWLQTLHKLQFRQFLKPGISYRSERDDTMHGHN